MSNYATKGKVVEWIVIGFIAMLYLGCKPGRPQFALPKITLITGQNLHSVVSVTPQKVFLFGRYGTIYHTTTGGTSVEEWKPQESGEDTTLLCEAAFIDPNKGWVVGIKGTIIRTVDGGKSWHKLESGTGKNLFSVSFADGQRGWAVGEAHTIIHTRDGGDSWIAQSEEIDKALNGVYFIDSRNGWAVGEFGTILHTTDGGETWEKQHCKDIEVTVDMYSFDWKPMPALYEVYFKDEQRGWIVGMDGVILTTKDGGKLWRKLESNCDIPFYGIAIKGDKGWIVGNSGYYLVSIDGGETWEIKDGVIKTRVWLRDIVFTDENMGWIVGAQGTVARSTDGGESWKLVSGISYDMPEYGLADF
jgi:photosystem II stability/assembly factor-like uncharacterized protein